ncbi:MAG: glycosyltransferase [Candidatus Eisenbacteria bacterium]
MTDDPIAGSRYTSAKRILFLGAPDSPHSERWIRFLQGRGHDVHVATIHKIPDWARPISTPLRGSGDEIHPGGLGDLPEAVRRLRPLVREFRPDATIAYYLTSYGLFAALAKAPNTFGATAGGDILEDPWDSWSRRIRNRLILAVALRHPKGFLAWADHVGARLVSLGIPRDRILVRARGVNLERFHGRRAAPGGSDGNVARILSIRWFKRLYDVATLIRALGILKAEGVRFHATVAGEGPEEANLRALAAELGLGDTVEFPGKLTEDGVVTELSRHEIYVSTSTTDGASSSLFEALAMGCYPVVTDIPANQEFLRDPKRGRLFPAMDADALAAALRDAIRETTSGSDAAERNRAFAAEHLDFAKNMKEIEAFVLGAAK